MATELWRSNLKLLRKKLGKTQSDIAFQLNATQQAIGNWETGSGSPSYQDLIKLTKIFGISVDDFLTNAHPITKPVGKKNQENAHLNAHRNAQVMPQNALKDDGGLHRSQPAKIVPVVVTIDSQGRDNITLVPVKARAGYLLGYGDAGFIKTLPVYRLPGLNNGSFRAFEVEGFSMYNTIGPGDIVIGSYVEQARHCRDERVYIFVTKDDGILIKRAINRVDKEGKFILKSDNITDRDQYPITLLDVSQISEIWYVEAVLSKNLRAPSAIYNRLTDLEAELAIIKSKINQKIK